jgi:2-polyprenyl-3-methyl-5-hydroxy-6-metoxy-1,4-benzoquinol methylase
MSEALPVDPAALRKEVIAKYRDGATNPHGAFHFHTGWPLARRLGYDEAIVARMPESAIKAFAGVGNPFSQGALNCGEQVVDLGSGGGVGCFVAGGQVGEEGLVIGVDMTDEMLERSRGAATQMRLGNIEFRRGIIEDLPVEGGWADVVISNGVINLCADKRRVFSEVMRVLKPGGRCSSPTSPMARKFQLARCATSTCGPTELPVACRARAGSRCCSRVVSEDVRFGPPVDTFGGAGGESKARLFEVFGYAFIAHKPK